MKKKGCFPIIERDISWLYFNHRILQEAQRKEVPLLERVSFLGIYSNNLDEFFRVRVATLNRIAETDNRALEQESKIAYHTLQKVNKLNALYSTEFIDTVNKTTDELKTQNICIINDNQVTSEQQSFIKKYYQSKMKGTTHPIWLRCISSLNNEADDAIYMAVKMLKWKVNYKRPRNEYALIMLPVKELGRFLRLPDNDGKCYLMYMDDVLRYCMPWVFAGLGYDNFEAYAFKFTKDAEMDIDNDLSIGKLQKVQRGVKSRKQGLPIRVLYDNAMPKDLLKKIMTKFKLGRLDTASPSGRYYNHNDFISFPDCGRKDLKYPTWPQIQLPEFNTNNSVLNVIRRKDRFIHTPYYSFDAYLRFLGEAALSPDVKEIKITLYRLAKDSKVVATLIDAAKNGKRVTAVIELLARFDEANNITLSKEMQDAGINVIFGVEGLKIHSKLTLIEAHSGDVVCIGTGNFHEGNARVYTDCLLFTAAKYIVKDVKNVFEFIQAPFMPVKYKELLVSPNDMKNQILHMMNNEINNRRQGKKAYIKVKINHVTDEDILHAIYTAAAEGVTVDMMIRGNCALTTTIPELNDNLRIHGLIDRYLEHSRILIFCNNGNERYYMGSSDWMSRNFSNRIEVMTPVYDEDIQQELERIVDYGLKDTMQGRIVDGSGDNNFWPVPEGEKPFRSQEELYNYYLQKSSDKK
jgi:polyphosphate kinase